MPLAGLTARRGTGTLGFHPSDVDKEAARRQVAKMVEGMAPDAVDEATGDRLDNLVNTWEDQWLTGVQQEYASYREQAGKLAGEEAAISPSSTRSGRATVTNWPRRRRDSTRPDTAIRPAARGDFPGT